MSLPPNDLLLIEVVPIELGFCRVMVCGKVGIGSEGNIYGKQIQEAIHDVVCRDKPQGIVVDCRQLEYRFSNYMVGALLGKNFPRKRMCILAQGETLMCLRPLWNVSRMVKILPIFDDESEAIEYITRNIE